MRKTLILLGILSLSLQGLAQIDPATTLWYASPAEKWAAALPIGNGRLAGMYFGNVQTDRLQFNEESYWTGGPYSTVVKGGSAKLAEIRKLLFEGRGIEAHHLFGRYLLGYPVEQQKYQSLGNLVLDFTDKSPVTDYRRELDLDTGITRITYTRGGVHYVREAFVSHPDQVIVFRVAADRPGMISFECQLRGVRNQAHSNYATDYFRMDPLGDDGLLLTGKGADYLGIEGKIRYEARLKARVRGGRVRTQIKSLFVEKADEVVFVLVAATNFNSYKDVSGDCHKRAENAMAQVEKRDFTGLKNDHIRDNQSLFRRVRLELPTTANSFLPTDIRVQKIQTEADPALAALCYQFGRYLLIASSRPGCEPANLQGKWNDDQNPSWDSKYTTNINLQMNYWMADSANLGECSLPLFKLIREVSDQGRGVAREHYGAGGWVFHQNTDLWRVAAPMDGANWGGFTTGGAWLCTHIWEHYAFTKDKAFLKEYYPEMKGCAEFFLDFLVPDPVRGWLVTNPSTSPENSPGSPGNGVFFDEINAVDWKADPGTKLCVGSTIDIQILLDLFQEVARTCEILGVDRDFLEKILKTRARLAPMQVGKDGTLQEWLDDWPQQEKQHRHIAHSYGLQPGHVISPGRTPELIAPIKKVLDQRGDESTGWARAWKMGGWARLGNGDRAYRIWIGYLKDQCFSSLFAKCGTALQVDGSLGVGHAISEMLVQSQEGAIELLPALPTAWSEQGHFSGVVTRGAFELDYSWRNGKIATLTLLSKAGEPCRITGPANLRVTRNGHSIAAEKNADGTWTFPTEARGVYRLEM
jgi:alpha-L-fucosidase 2